MTDASEDVVADSAAGPCSSETQDGVKQIEAVSMVWSQWGLVFAYVGIFLMSFTTSLEGQVTLPLSAFAVSEFKTHSLISTVFVVQGIINAVIKPPMAKLADVFGRLEAFSVSVLLCALGYAQMAASHSVQTYASAQIFYSAGGTGLQILQQIFIADTSTLLNRALFSSLPDTPFLATVWIGPTIASALLAVTTWRWGYGMWAVILPLTFLPLALSLFLNRRKAWRLGLIARRHSYRDFSGPTALRTLFLDLDIVGILILSGAFALILLPLTLASRAQDTWQNPGIVGLIILGIALLAAFPVWESQPKLAPHPLIPLDLLKSRKFCAGCGIGFFYFMVFYMSVQPYFYSYLLVVHGQSVSAAGRITQTFSFAATMANIASSLLIQRTARCKPFLVAGAAVYLGATLLMLRLRTAASSVALLIAAQAALGIGASLQHLPAQLAVQSCATTHQQVGAATAVFLTLVEVGGAVGAAVSGAVWSSLVPAKLARYLPPGVGPAEAHDIYASVIKACSYAAGSPEREAINRAYQETMTALLTVAAGMCVPLLLLSLVMEDTRLDRADQHVRGRVIGGGVTLATATATTTSNHAETGPARRAGLGRSWLARDFRRRVTQEPGAENERTGLVARHRE